MPNSLDVVQTKEAERLEVAAALRAHKLASQGRTASGRGAGASGRRRRPRGSVACASTDPLSEGESAGATSLTLGEDFWEGLEKKASRPPRAKNAAR